MAYSDWTTTMLQPIITMVFLAIFLSRETHADELKTYEMSGDTCGSVIQIGDQFKAISKMVGTPGHDNYTYESGLNCELSFITEKNQKFFLRITEFNLEMSTRCSKDRLTLYDGDMQNNQFIFSTESICGPTKSLPNYYYSQTNGVTVKFVTNGDNGDLSDNDGEPYKGFQLLLTPYISSENVTYCEGFRCDLSGACITQDAFCNDEFQCKDASDEPDGCKRGGANTNAVLSAFLIHFGWILAWSMKNIMTIPSDGKVTF